jgi:hypothetical protein
MWQEKAPWFFAVLVACAAGFVWVTCQGLPELVAAHFGASGAANGFMPRRGYVWFTLGFVIGLPAVMVWLSWFAIKRPGARINLPHRDYWLAPARRDQTIGRLRAAILQFGVLLLIFLCYAHGLVVRANMTQPAQLASTWFVGGLVVFLLALLFWARAFLGGFRRDS